MSLGKVIEEIKALEHDRLLVCPNCGLKIHCHVLQVYADCPQCGRIAKLRGMGGIGTEIQDVFDAVLEWFAEEGTFDNALKRYQVIKRDRESDGS